MGLRSIHTISLNLQIRLSTGRVWCNVKRILFLRLTEGQQALFGLGREGLANVAVKGHLVALHILAPTAHEVGVFERVVRLQKVLLREVNAAYFALVHTLHGD